MHSKVHVALEKNNKKKNTGLQMFCFFPDSGFSISFFFFIEDYE